RHPSQISPKLPLRRSYLALIHALSFPYPFAHTPRYNSSPQILKVLLSTYDPKEKKNHIRLQNRVDFCCRFSKLLSAVPDHPPNFPHKPQTINRKMTASRFANGYNQESIRLYVLH